MLVRKNISTAIHLVCSPGRQTHETHSLLEVGLPVQLEQGDVVVQRLAVVVVVNVGGGHPEGLRPRGAVLLSQIVVTNTDIDGVTRPDNAEKGKFNFKYNFLVGCISLSHIL